MGLKSMKIMKYTKLALTMVPLSCTLVAFQNCTSSGFSSGSSSGSSSQNSSSSAAIPVVSLSVNNSSINTGGNATLTWSAVNATSCIATGGTFVGNEQTQGSLVVSPSTTTIYSLNCSNSVGSASQSVTVTVIASLPTITLSANPSSVAVGASSVLTWSSQNATSCTASGSWSGTKATSGTSTQIPASTGTNTYSLSCTGPGGSSTQSTTVTVSNPAAPTVSLTASQSTIISGASTTLTWSAPGATACTPTGFSIASGSPASGSVSVTPTATTTYALTCSDSSGNSAPQSVTVTVNPPVPTVSISASPSSIVSGNSSTITWSSTNATTCTASGSWSGTKANSGTLSVSPTVSSTYILTCSDISGNSAPQSTTVSVTTVALPTATLTTSQASIGSGSSSVLTWSSANATSCTGTGFSTGTATSGTVTVTPTTTATYSVVCAGTGGTSPAASTTVSVTSNGLACAQNSSSSALGTVITNASGAITTNTYDTNATSCPIDTTYGAIYGICYGSYAVQPNVYGVWGSMPDNVNFSMWSNSASCWGVNLSVPTVNFGDPAYWNAPVVTRGFSDGVNAKLTSAGGVQVASLNSTYAATTSHCPTTGASGSVCAKWSMSVPGVTTGSAANTMAATYTAWDALLDIYFHATPTPTKAQATTFDLQIYQMVMDNNDSGSPTVSTPGWATFIVGSGKYTTKTIGGITYLVSVNMGNPGSEDSGWVGSGGKYNCISMFPLPTYPTTTGGTGSYLWGMASAEHDVGGIISWLSQTTTVNGVAGIYDDNGKLLYDNVRGASVTTPLLDPTFYLTGLNPGFEIILARTNSLENSSGNYTSNTQFNTNDLWIALPGETVGN